MASLTSSNDSHLEIAADQARSASFWPLGVIHPDIVSDRPSFNDLLVEYSASFITSRKALSFRSAESIHSHASPRSALISSTVSSVATSCETSFAVPSASQPMVVMHKTGTSKHIPTLNILEYNFIFFC